MDNLQKVQAYTETFVSETPNWALAGMGVSLFVFGWFVEHTFFVQQMGGLLIAVIVVNILYDYDVLSGESNKTFVQVMLLSAAVGGLVITEIIKSALTDLTGSLRAIQVLGLIVLVSRLGVNLSRIKAGNTPTAVILDGRNDTYGMYAGGLIAIFSPKLLEFLWLGQYYVWMSYVSLVLAFISFGAVYIVRND